jgi:hypothetical protein
MALFETLAGIGGIGSLVGGIFGASGAKSAANAQVQAGRDALDLYDDRTSFGQALQLALALGGENALPMLQGMLPADQYEELFGRQATSGTPLSESEQRRLQEIDARISELNSGATRANTRAMFGTGVGGRPRGASSSGNAEVQRLQGEREALMKKSGGDPGKAGKYSLDQFRKIGGQSGTIGEMKSLSDAFKTQGEGRLRDFDQMLARIDGMGAQTKADAAKNYQDEIGAAERNAARREQALNRGSLASLANAGLGGSSLAASQMQGNSRGIAEGLADQTRNINQAKTGFMANLDNANINRSMQGGLARGDFARGIDTQVFQAQQSPISAKFGLTTGAAFNPFLGQNTTQYFPGVSPSGAMASSIGNTLGAAGGTALGYGLQGMAQNDMLTRLQQMG